MSRSGIAVLIGLDRAVVLTVLARAWSVIAGLLTVWMIGLYLSPQLQGYFFTLGSLIGLQVLAELGLNQAIVHFASHEVARLRWGIDGTLEGSPEAKARLRALMRFALQWFGCAGLLLALVLLPLGVHFLGTADGTAPPGTLLAWSLLVPLTVVNLLAGAALSVLEGCGRVADVSLARLLQNVASTGVLWVGLAAGAGLMALAIQAAAGVLTVLAWVVFAFPTFFRDLLRGRERDGGFDWRAELWPFQWRIAVSWASGFLIAQLFTPLLFATHGAVAAGRMGMTLQMFGALNMVALAWITSHVPRYGRMIALGQGVELDRMFVRGLVQSSAVLLALVTAALAVVWELQANGSPLAERLLPLPLVAVLCVVALANHVVFAQAALLRSHKQDPFMSLSVASGLVTAVLAFAWIPEYGLEGAAAAYATATLVVGLGGGTVVFLNKRRQWWMTRGAGALHAGSTHQ